MGELTGAVGADVEEYDYVVVFEPHAVVGAGGDRDGAQELVSFAVVVALLDISGGAGMGGVVVGGEGVVSLLDALPAVVAVHGEVAAGEASNAGRTGGG